MTSQLFDYFGEGEILAVKGAMDRPISGLAMDSRRVVPGNLFFALPGRRTDGSAFIDEAVSRGASAVVSLTLPTHPPSKVTFIRVSDPRAALARVSRRYYNFPDKDMSVVGVTGTNGKTTITHLIRHLMNGGEKVGLLGTISYDLGARTVPSFRTTPEAPDIFGMMAQMRDAGCRRVVMEVSSHGIDQQRILGLQFSVAVFTNLTRDHLDYHKTLDSYFEVKSRLFTGATGSAPGTAVVNIDDPYGAKLAGMLSSGASPIRVVTYGEGSGAMFRAESVVLDFKNTAFRLRWPAAGGGESRELEVESPLIGRYNVSNLLGAVATAWALGSDPAAVLSRLRDFPGVPGRMERIEEGQPFNVLVDYAHTDDALRNALGMLRAITPGNLLVVFGCGGNRDRTKRPLMVRAVQEFADIAFATADNPRSERLGQIFADMRAGVSAPERIRWIEDRRHAISLALDAAAPGDCLLIAGKGHESCQEFADTIVPFDDRQVVRELIGVKTLREP
jgi:UDP-N-acetylmuramoyl-L-alanyl-D-glutamate--2,6-diaminopimelate ligase